MTMTPKRFTAPEIDGASFFASLAQFNRFKGFVYEMLKLSAVRKFKDGQDVTKYVLALKNSPAWLRGNRVTWAKDRPRTLNPIFVLKGDRVTGGGRHGQDLWCEGLSMCLYRDDHLLGCVYVHGCIDCVKIDFDEECFGDITVWA
jgi:hypothetical protein